MNGKRRSVSSLRPRSSKSNSILANSQVVLENSRINIPMLAGTWPTNQIKKQLLHIQSHKGIEQHFRKYTNRLKEENEFLQRVVNKASSFVKLTKSTQQTKDIVTKHCQLNQAIKNNDDFLEESFKQKQDDREQFLEKFKLLNTPKRQFNRDKIDLVISKSRQKYQLSKAGVNKQNINQLVGMFGNFEELCRRQRKEVNHRLSKLEEISASLSNKATKQRISVDEFLKHSRVFSRSQIGTHS